MDTGKTQVSRRGDPALLGAIAAALAGLLAYLPSLGGDFVNWDDEDYVRDNLYLRALNGRFVEWAFTEFFAANWYPLTWASHALDVAVWGLDPFGHHLGNVLLHALNCALVAGLVRAWLLRTGHGAEVPWAAAVAGIGFALHPIHVEAVAWVSQRKELLCAAFYLAGLLLYLKPAAGPRGRVAAYAGALACHGAALMAKPMAVSFPLVLLLLDIHPLGRWRSARSAAVAIAAKLPFVALSGGAAVLALAAQAAGGALAEGDTLPLAHRLHTATLALAFYARDMVLPAWLAPLYPYPEWPGVASWGFWLPVAAAAAALAVTLAVARRKPGLAVALAALLCALLPVLGLVQVGGQARADRYLYLPGVALFALFGIAAARSLRRMPFAALPGLTLVAAAWTALAVTQQGAWRDGASLWTRQIEVHPGYGPGYTYRAHAWAEAGAFDAAELDLERAQRLPPPSPEPAYYLGDLRLRQGRVREALEPFAAAVAQSQWPDARFHADLGRAYALLGRADLALAAFDEALRIEPPPPQRRVLRACALAQLGRRREAAEEFARVDAALPVLPQPLAALGAALAAGAGELDAPCSARYRADPL